VSGVDPASQVLSRIGEAEAWLRRARLEWRRGERARTVLTLSLAEAELRVARQEALSAPQPDGRSSAIPRVALTAVCTALSVMLGAGVWLGVRWTGQEPVARGPTARGVEARPVTLSYVPGNVLRLVVPAPEKVPAAPRPVEVALVTEREVLPVRLTVSGEWPLRGGWWGAEPLRLPGAGRLPVVAPTP
jgi:hypothetical protein